MPTFANREALSSVRAKLNSAIERIDAYGATPILSYSTLADFQAAVTAGLTRVNGSYLTAAGTGYVAEAGAALAGIPAGWRPVDWVYSRAELEAATWEVAPGRNVILVLESGFAVPYVRTPFATDLIAGDLSTWKVAGFTIADAVAIGNEIAAANAALATSLRNIADGSAADPGFKFSLDLDTGFYRPGDNQIGLATNGVSRAVLSDTALAVSVPITGTAVQSSATDATSGVLLKSGAFGLGANAGILVTDYDALTISGIYRNSAIATGSPIASSLYWSVLHLAHTSDGTSSQFAMRSAGTTANQMYFRRKAGGVWSGWDKVFHSGNLLGTVSQTGGAPTGAVIERGSNANGEYVKFADGTMICTKTMAGLGPISTASGSLFVQSPGLTIGTLPATFIAVPVRHCDVYSLAGVTAWVQSSTAPTTTTGGEVQLVKATTTAAVDFTVTATFIGRWF